MKITRLFFFYLTYVPCIACEGSAKKVPLSKEDHKKLVQLLKIKDQKAFDTTYQAEKDTFDEAKRRLMETIFNIDKGWRESQKENEDNLRKIPMSSTWLDQLVQHERLFNYIFCLSSYLLEEKFIFKELFKNSIDVLSTEQKKNIVIDFLSQYGLEDGTHNTIDQETIWIKSLIKNSPPITHKIFQKAESFLSTYEHLRVFIHRVNDENEQKIINAWKEALSLQRTITDEDKERVKQLLGKTFEVDEIEVLAEASVAVVYKVKIDNIFYAVKVIKEGIAEEIKKNTQAYVDLAIHQSEKEIVFLQALQDKILKEADLSTERENIKKGNKVYQGVHGVRVVSLPAIDANVKQQDTVLFMNIIDGKPLSDYLIQMKEKLDKGLDAAQTEAFENEINQIKQSIENLTLLFFNKLYCGDTTFFHADMHLGNLLVDQKTKELYIVDFGFAGHRLDKVYKIKASNKHYEKTKKEITLKEMLIELQSLFKSWYEKARKVRKESGNARDLAVEMAQKVIYCINPALTVQGGGPSFHSQEDIQALCKKGIKSITQTQMELWITRCQQGTYSSNSVKNAEHDLYGVINSSMQGRVQITVDHDFQLAYNALTFVNKMRKKFNEQIGVFNSDSNYNFHFDEIKKLKLEAIKNPLYKTETYWQAKEPTSTPTPPPKIPTPPLEKTPKPPLENDTELDEPTDEKETKDDKKGKNPWNLSLYVGIPCIGIGFLSLLVILMRKARATQKRTEDDQEL
ncbi:MAG: AarF/UbiB family protein [Bacteroidota bacterium]